MRVGIISVYRDPRRQGKRNRLSMQPQVGPLLAGMFPDDVDVTVENETWEAADLDQFYDLVFFSTMHSDLDRAIALSRHHQRQGSKTVIGGTVAQMFPHIVAPHFDSVVIGDPEPVMPWLYRDFVSGALAPKYQSVGYVPELIKTPRWDLTRGRFRFVLEATRGCPFTCSFCVLTGLGTRHELRPVEGVLRDIDAGIRALPFPQNRIVGFADNNLAGNLSWFRALMAGLKDRSLRWHAPVTFNVIANPGRVKQMADSGCCALFVGLESFNQDTLTAMGKNQNVIAKIKDALDCCQDNGIYIVSGLMLSPRNDTLSYIHSIPERLDHVGLRVPTFISFETPIPGTPLFAKSRDHLLPNALLRDFTGSTLVTRPAHATPDAFVEAYVKIVQEVFLWTRRTKNLALRLPKLLVNGGLAPALAAIGDMASIQTGIDPERSYIAGTDKPYPEDAGMEMQWPLLRVTNPYGKVMEKWL